MTELMRALTACFARAGMPVYLRGWVPAGAERPLVILAVEAADRLRVGGVTAEIRVRGATRDGQSANERLLAGMDALAALVSPGGLTLHPGGGCAMLRRADTGFRELTAGPSDGGDCAGRLRFTLWTF